MRAFTMRHQLYTITTSSLLLVVSAAASTFLDQLPACWQTCIKKRGPQCASTDLNCKRPPSPQRSSLPLPHPHPSSTIYIYQSRYPTLTTEHRPMPHRRNLHPPTPPPHLCPQKLRHEILPRIPDRPITRRANSVRRNAIPDPRRGRESGGRLCRERVQCRCECRGARRGKYYEGAGNEELAWGCYCDYGACVGIGWWK